MLEFLWVSENIPFIITFEANLVNFNLINQNNPLYFESRNEVLSVLADQAALILKPIFKVKTVCPIKAVVTQGFT